MMSGRRHRGILVMCCGSLAGSVGPCSVWPAAIGGVTRSPFTAIVFAFELTHDQNVLLALLVTATVAHLVSVLV